MIKIKEAIVVEGKYDKIRLSSVFDTIIIAVGGFNIFRDEKTQKFIKKIAEEKGIIVLTDSDRAGFLIRNFINGTVDGKYIKHAYIPQIEGKEKRKVQRSKDGFLGVEGISNEILETAVKSAASIENSKRHDITKATLYAYGLCGGVGSGKKRSELLKMLDLPEGITTNPLIAILNELYTAEEFDTIAKKLTKC